jgi:hypothetical protein
VTVPSSGEVEPVPSFCVRQGPLAPGDACVFQNLTERFAIYRGSTPSQRDYTFGYSVVGGSTVLSANIGSGTSVLPEHMLYVPQLGQLAVVDTASAGLSLVSLDSLGTSQVFF